MHKVEICWADFMYVIAYFGISQLKMCNLELFKCHLINRDKIDYYHLKDIDINLSSINLTIDSVA